jgi:CTP synthase (UTP-ammonia lyase)
MMVVIWTSIRLGKLLERIYKSFSHIEQKHHKPWINEECSKLLDQRNLNCSGCRIKAKQMEIM